MPAGAPLRVRFRSARQHRRPPVSGALGGFEAARAAPGCRLDPRLRVGIAWPPCRDVLSPGAASHLRRAPRFRGASFLLVRLGRRAGRPPGLCGRPICRAPPAPGQGELGPVRVVFGSAALSPKLADKPPRHTRQSSATRPSAPRDTRSRSPSRTAPTARFSGPVLGS